MLLEQFVGAFFMSSSCHHMWCNVSFSIFMSIFLRLVLYTFTLFFYKRSLGTSILSWFLCQSPHLMHASVDLGNWTLTPVGVFPWPLFWVKSSSIIGVLWRGWRHRHLVLLVFSTGGETLVIGLLQQERYKMTQTITFQYLLLNTLPIIS